jgi:hypothetical protein
MAELVERVREYLARPKPNSHDDTVVRIPLSALLVEKPIGPAVLDQSFGTPEGLIVSYPHPYAFGDFARRMPVISTAGEFIAPVGNVAAD